MKKRRTWLEKAIDNIFGRIVEIDESNQITIGQLFEDFRNKPDFEPLTNVEFNDICSLEIGDLINVRGIDIKRIK
jgi:hypothetical protein